MLALALWAIVATGVVELWMVYTLSFLQGVVTSLDTPTRQSFFAEMVGHGAPHERREPEQRRDDRAPGSSVPRSPGC